MNNSFKKILVVRTDRIGDVVLTTPVFKALRENYPQAHIAAMVSPHTKEILEGSPYIDEIIVYDKDKHHKGAAAFWKFVLRLKKKRFDLAIVLHTKKRLNLITFLANIPRRIGFAEKGKFSLLLTDRLKDTRPLGLKHEADYCLDVLKELGLKLMDRKLHISLKKEALDWAEQVLAENGIGKDDKIAVIHPGASCPSKRWFKERFAVLADKLAQDYGFKIIVISGPKDIAIADDIEKDSKHKIINLAGKISLSQTAAILKKANIFISNDSGPVHISSAVGTPVISIFGRNQAGLSPLRWGPLGERDKYLHKPPGCNICLAHKCLKGFDCLKAITIEDVLGAVDKILER